MWGAWILLLMCVTLGGCQDQYVEYEYVYDDYADVAVQETKPKARLQTPAPAPVAPPKLKPRRPSTGGSKKHKPRGTTPVPIVKDIRRIDPVTGAFYYHYEGGDGSMKHEVRFPNGTVLGNYTYVKENGELETHTYHHGLGSNIVDNDNGDYELHRHLEQGYVHQSGPDPVETLLAEDAPLQPNSVRVETSRPIAQSRPVPRARLRARPRPVPIQQTQSVFNAPQSIPLDYHDSQTTFTFQDDSNYVDVDQYQGQESNLQPVVEFVESLPQSYEFDYDQHSEPLQVSEQ